MPKLREDKTDYSKLAKYYKRKYLILIILGIGGSIYFISYKNDSQAKIENETNSIMTENII